MTLQYGTSGRSSGVELQPSKLAVASSNLVARSISAHKLTVNRYSLIVNQQQQVLRLTNNVSRLTINDGSAHVAQLAEHVLGKDEVTRSIRVVGSIIKPAHPGPVGTGPFPVGLLGPALRSHEPGDTRHPGED